MWLPEALWLRIKELKRTTHVNALIRLIVPGRPPFRSSALSPGRVQTRPERDAPWKGFWGRAVNNNQPPRTGLGFGRTGLIPLFPAYMREEAPCFRQPPSSSPSTLLAASFQQTPSSTSPSGLTSTATDTERPSRSRTHSGESSRLAACFFPRPPLPPPVPEMRWGSASSYARARRYEHAAACCVRACLFPPITPSEGPCLSAGMGWAIKP